MKDDLPKDLHDILKSAKAIKSFVAGKSFKDYRADDLLRSGVERKFEIIGEALNRIGKISPDVLSHIRGQRDIISFRNILAHGYDTIDDRIVWGVIEEDPDHLLADIKKLLMRITTSSCHFPPARGIVRTDWGNEVQQS